MRFDASTGVERVAAYQRLFLVSHEIVVEVPNDGSLCIARAPDGFDEACIGRSYRVCQKDSTTPCLNVCPDACDGVA